MNSPKPIPVLSRGSASPVPSLAEVPEAAADAAVAAVYRDIQAVLGVRLVNLIYRHLATVPGALDWAWQALRPHFMSGALATQARQLRAAAAQTVCGWSLEPGPPAAGVAELVATYNQANSLNLMALTHLLGLGDPADGNVAAEADGPAAPDGQANGCEALPPLPAWHELPPAQQQCVLRLNRFGEPGEPQIVASLYRHLACWPDLPPRIEPSLQALETAGAIAAARAGTAQAAACIAGHHRLAISGATPPAVNAELLTRLRSFARVTLPKMVPIGLALHAAFTADRRPSPQPGSIPCT